MAIQFWHYPNCSTCRKAKKWLDQRGVKVTAIDIVDSPPSATVLAKVKQLSGVPVNKLFNTSGQVYREGKYKEKLAKMSEKEALQALASQGKLIKRPLLLAGDVALVGFREGDYAELFK
ncbi:MAG: arsenate reductase family protein [Myxococcales bacterium]|nr:arsenate reductase family protein [Myxococcales bacterium]